MVKHAGFAPLLLLSALALAGDGDAVNERIPVSRAALEDHWQVDCAAAWARLQAAAQRPTQKQCEITAGLAQEIKLCAFIYQTPGENTAYDCPDYRSAAQLLQRTGNSKDCPELASLIATELNCQGAGP
jgi:hypothetical protein